LRVKATDDGGEDFEGQAVSRIVESNIMIFPAPRVLDVVPSVLPATGGVNVTVVGLYFGSPYSRGYEEPAFGYGLLDVIIGGQQCTNVKVKSDTQVICTVPAMVGTHAVDVVVLEPGLERSGRMARTITFNAVYFGGILERRSARGVVGTGPSSNLSVPFVEWVPRGVEAQAPSEWRGVPVSVDELVVDNTVLSMLFHEAIVFVGGNFKMGGSVKVNHIMEWNGGLVRSMGKGVDGAVHSLIIYKELLVVGGTFTKAYQSNGGSLRTGGLAGWNLGRGSGQVGRWELVGAPLQGAVMSSAVNGSRLFVGGRFNQFCSQRFNGVAMFNGTAWEPLGQGVGAGGVLSMAVLGDMLYVGGDFSSAGGKPLGKIAAWSVLTSEWRFFGKVDGEVLTMLEWDSHILVGGAFVTAGDKLCFGVARYTPADMGEGPQTDLDDGWNDDSQQRLGEWNPVGRGIEGRVNRLAAAGSCLYAAGDFINVSEHMGTRPAVANLARYCPNGQTEAASALWEPAVIVNGGERQQLAPLYALASSVPQGAAQWVPQYICSVNVTNATNGSQTENGTCVPAQT